MRRVLIGLLFALGLSVPGWAQGIPYNNVAFTLNNMGEVIPAGGAQIDVCQPTDTGLPCTNHVNIFSDAAMAHPITQPFFADLYGNFNFYAATCGPFVYTVTGATVLPKSYPINPCGNGGAINPSSVDGTIFVDGVTYKFTDAGLSAAITAACASGKPVNAFGYGAMSVTVNSTLSLGCTSPTTTLSIEFNPATLWVPATSATDVFLILPYAQVTGPSVDVRGVSGYSGNAFKFAGNKYNDQPGDLTTTQGHTILDNWTVYGCPNSTGTGLLLTSVNGANDYVQFVDVNRGSICGMLYGLHALASGGGWVNGNNINGLRVSNAVHGLKLEAAGTLGSGGVSSNFITNYQEEWAGDFTSQGVDAVWVAGPGTCFANHLKQFNTWDWITGGGRHTVLVDSSCQANQFDGSFNSTLALDNSGVSCFYDDSSGNSSGCTTYNAGVITAPVFNATTPATAYRIGGSNILLGDGSNTYIKPQAASSTVFLQNFAASKSWQFLDSGNTVLPGLLSSYNGISTAGNGTASIYGATSQKSETGADANVLTFTPPATVGTYRIRFDLSLSAANAATLGWTATWKDSNGNAQTPTNLSFYQQGTAAPALTFTTSAAGNYYADATIDTDNSATAIVVKLTFSGTSFAGKASATVERLN